MPPFEIVKVPPVNSFGFQQVAPTTSTPGDVFVTQLNATGTGFAFSSYLGGSAEENDQGFGGIALNGSNIFVTGSTMSTDFPTRSCRFNSPSPTAHPEESLRQVFSRSGWSCDEIW